MSHWQRRAGIGGVALLVVALVVYGYWPKPVAVEIVAVERGPMEVTVSDEGRTRVKDQYVVSAPVPGLAGRIELDAGDAVERNQPLARIYPAPSASLDPRTAAEAEARVEAAQAALRRTREELEAARAEAELADNEAARIEKLFQRGDASQAELDRARAESRRANARARSAQFSVRVASHELAQAKAARGHAANESSVRSREPLVVRSPIAGAVLEVRRESQAIVQAGQPLLVVGDTGALEVETEFLSEDAVPIEPGMPARFHRWGGQEPLAGTVRTVEPFGFTEISALGVEEQRVRVIADITSPPEQWRSLGHGYRVETEVVVWRGKDVLQVPSGALFRRGEAWAVLVADNAHAWGQARLREVEIGRKSGLTAQVLDGLKSGDRVIDHPPQDVQDGDPIVDREG